jgi:hypothetical protein
MENENQQTETRTESPEVIAERERASGIRQTVERARLGHDLADVLVARGVSLDAARAPCWTGSPRATSSRPSTTSRADLPLPRRQSGSASDGRRGPRPEAHRARDDDGRLRQHPQRRGRRGRPSPTHAGTACRSRWVMRVSGRKTRAVLERYNVVAEEDLRDAARRIEGARLRHQSCAGGTDPKAPPATAEGA